MPIRAVIFDMDGLLVDSEPIWDDARARMARAHGQEWTRQDHLNVMGVNTREWSEYMIDRLRLSMTPQQVQDEIILQMREIYLRQIPFKPFAVQAVRWAAKRYPVALASGSPRELIEILTTSPDLNGCFSVVLSADEVGVGKPDPKIYLETARRLGIRAEECLCLEDSAFGVLSGRRANMFVINVPDPAFPLSAEMSANADLVLADLSEFSELAIQNLEQARLV